MEKIELFESTLRKHALFLWSKLNPALNNDEIDSFMRKIGIEDDIISAFYRWKNGVSYNINEPTLLYEFCSFGVMLPLEFISQICIPEDEYYEWEPHFFPIIGNYQGDYLLYNSDKNSSTYGMLHLYSAALLLVDEKITYYDSIETMVQSIIDCFESGAYRYNATNLEGLTIDDEKAIEINKKNNPLSEYWKSF